MLYRYLRFLNYHLVKLEWASLVLLLAFHFLLSWISLALAGEELASAHIFPHFYIVTASTVGYGDFSPESLPGRLVTSFWLIPGSLMLFAAFLGKLATGITQEWRRTLRGEADMSEFLKDHLVIMGWHPDRTPRMIDLIFGDRKRTPRKVLLCSARPMENPDPKRIEFVQGDSLTSQDVLHRGAVASAERIIIQGDNDDNTLAAALAVTAINKTAHIVCHFHDNSRAELLKAHEPQVETYISMSTDMIVRAAQDPGSSRVQQQMLSTLEGQTQFSLVVPEHFGGCKVESLLMHFKQKHDALIIALAKDHSGAELQLNPSLDRQVAAGDIVYLMSAHRLHPQDVAWQSIT
ncbi:potassium channel family protein [Endozoicomonadaceae bacterium StTr2]